MLQSSLQQLHKVSDVSIQEKNIATTRLHQDRVMWVQIESHNLISINHELILIFPSDKFCSETVDIFGLASTHFQHTFCSTQRYYNFILSISYAHCRKSHQYFHPCEINDSCFIPPFSCSFSGFICLQMDFLHENVIHMRMGKFLFFQFIFLDNYDENSR